MTSWAGDLHLGDGWLCYRGPLGGAQPHAHHAVQVCLSESPFQLVDGSGAAVEARSAVIPADAVHGLNGRGQAATLLYLPRLRSSAVGQDPADWVAAASHLGIAGPGEGVDLGGWASAIAVRLGAMDPERDALIAAAMDQARAFLPGRARLAEVAASVGLSTSGLSHRFTRTVGVPWRVWVLGERLTAASRIVAGGGTLTDAAHGAGFADSSHLTRTFRRMFGIAPSEVAAVVRWHVHG